VQLAQNDRVLIDRVLKHFGLTGAVDGLHCRHQTGLRRQRIAGVAPVPCIYVANFPIKFNSLKLNVNQLPAVLNEPL
jgi:hypothetical protein